VLLGLHLAEAPFHYDDSLDVFGVHGIGGMTGILLAGVFATASIGGTFGLEGLDISQHGEALQQKFPI